MKILILHTLREKTPNNEFVSLETIEALARCIRASKHDVSTCLYSPFSIRRSLEQTKPVLIFHLAYGYVAHNFFENQPDTTKRLEHLGQNTTGASAKAQYLAQDKIDTAVMLSKVGVNSPTLVLPNHEPSSEYVILKPRDGACHRGIRVIHRSELNDINKLPSGMLVQEFIPGPELTVGVLERNTGIEVLPPLKIVYENRSGPQYMNWDLCRWKYELDKKDEYGLKELALLAFKQLGLRDYARFDFRISNNGPILLDANSLPNLHPEISLLPLASSLAGISYCELVNNILNNAIKRCNATSISYLPV